MARFYPVEIKLDGRIYRGDWTIVQGGRVCVRTLGYGSMTDDLGGEKPEVVAPRLLERIIREYDARQADELKRQQREMAKLRRQRLAKDKRLAEQLKGHADPVMETLRRLVEQIEGSDYRDMHGNPLEMNMIFRDAVALLAEHGVRSEPEL